MACCAPFSSWRGCALRFSWAPPRRVLRASMTASAAETACRVMVFARAPTPGEVKTRLIPALGEAGAAALHRRLVTHTLGAAADALIGPVELWCTPDTGDPFFFDCERRLRVSLHAQGQGDLGSRMRRAFESALARAP